MADDLSAPLGGRKRRASPATPKPASTKRKINLQLTELPLARIAFSVAALIIVGIGARILLVDDPMGGRPVAEIDVSSTRNVNAVADTVSATTSMATITAEPETPVDNSGVTIVGDDVPDGDPTAADLGPTGTDGLFPELLEETEYGPIPRIGTTGQRPFDAYARPSLTPETAGGRQAKRTGEASAA